MGSRLMRTVTIEVQSADGVLMKSDPFDVVGATLLSSATLLKRTRLEGIRAHGTRTGRKPVHA